jgi:hypothetical protein
VNRHLENCAPECYGRGQAWGVSIVLLASDDAERVFAWTGEWAPPESGHSTISTIVRPRFAAYVRILHRFEADEDSAEGTFRWAEMAARAGVPYVPNVTSRSIRGLPLPDENDWRWLWAPDEGDMDGVSRAALVALLSAYTDTDAFFAFGLAATMCGLSTPLVFRGRVGDLEEVRSAAGQLSDRRNLGDPHGPMTGPEWWWPADHSWLVVTDYDLDSTIVGAGAEVADAILADPLLEAFGVTPDMRLDDSADAPPTS